MDDYQDKQSRKWLLTINNPSNLGLTHDRIKESLTSIKSCVYWCMSDEIGAEGTYHTHVFIACKSGLRASTLHKKFTGAHRDIAKGTCSQNREYVTKTGKWANTDKSETSVDGTFEEWGEMPIERQGQRSDIDDLYQMIKDGLSDYEILEQSPNYLLHMEKIDKARKVIRQHQLKDSRRDVHVVYIWGDTGTGKTRYVMDKYGYSNVYRVTDYKHPFDSYRGQDVIVFEEYRSNFTVNDFLNYIDVYPLELPCRFWNDYAAYTKVYIISNIPLSEQYKFIQLESFESYRAILRRIHEVRHYTSQGIEYSRIDLTANGFHLVVCPCPFEEKKE